MEWANACMSLILPTNWAQGRLTPFGFSTPDAQNCIAHEALRGGWEWVFFHEDDNLLPPKTWVLLEPYLRKKEIPVISGLYHIKGTREPLMYRGAGTGAYWPGPKTWTPGDLVWVDGVPTGALLVHRSILEVMAEDAEEYELRSNGVTTRVKRIFEAPRDIWIDPATGSYQTKIGTSDLYWCRTIIKQNVLARAGWKKIARKPYPFAVLTELTVGHIDRSTGEVW